MSTKRRALDGVTVLVTRPAGRGEALATGIREAGGEAIAFPVIRTRLDAPGDLLEPGGIDLSRFALAIFVSVPAVESVAESLRLKRDLLRGLPVAAIGPATAQALERSGIRVHFLPSGNADSEGLLAVLSGLPLENRDVVVYRGQQGRVLLENTLTARGARVHAVECYRRERVMNPPMEAFDRWLRAREGILTLTSVEILDALLAILSDDQCESVRRKPVAVLSDRIAIACRERGFSGPVAVARGAGDAAMVNTVYRLHAGS